MDDEIHVKFVCRHMNCRQTFTEFERTIKKYQLGLVAIWFHSSHEGHDFDYYEDGQLVLGKSELYET
ncbi:MAG: hypothetical protein QNJ81_02630 [Acidimicrobiia bacterium]|nr:hypothetical protein [Acidimicrobiia bacterium]